MPTDPESIAIYVIVLVTLGWLLRGLRRSRKRRPGCGKDCGCEVDRDPAIQRFIDRRER